MKLSFSEDVSPLKIKEILDCLNNVRAIQEEKKVPEKTPIDALTIIDKLKLLFEKLQKIGWFTSQHVKELYAHEFGEELKASTVATYLTRLFENSELQRRGSRVKREYLVEQIKEVSPIQV